LITAVDAQGIQGAPHDVITNTGEILDPTASDENHRVLLEVVPFARDISPNFSSVAQPDTRDLSQR
jgi:hypothetical protein